MRLLALAAAAVALTLTACTPTPASAPAASEQAATETQAAEQPAAETAAAEEPAAADGTRDNPLPAGSTIEGGTWSVVVGATVLDANAAVTEANQFNQPPADGQTYISVPIQATYTGDESAYTAEIQVAYVTASGETIDATSATVVTDDSMGLDELYNGGQASYSQYLMVPTDGLADGLIRVRPGFLDGEKFVALQ